MLPVAMLKPSHTQIISADTDHRTIASLVEAPLSGVSEMCIVLFFFGEHHHKMLGPLIF
jgi:hypothetical protein